MDMEKVIKAIECCVVNHTRCFDDNDKLCPYFSTKVYMCEIELLKDALELLKAQDDLGTELTNAVELIHKKNKRIEKLLKEQEAVEPIPYHRSDGTIFKYECRQCRTKIFKMDLFCRHCGRSVKWE